MKRRVNPLPWRMGRRPQSIGEEFGRVSIRDDPKSKTRHPPLLFETAEKCHIAIYRFSYWARDPQVLLQYIPYIEGPLETAPGLSVGVGGAWPISSRAAPNSADGIEPNTGLWAVGCGLHRLSLSLTLNSLARHQRRHLQFGGVVVCCCSMVTISYAPRGVARIGAPRLPVSWSGKRRRMGARCSSVHPLASRATGCTAESC